MPKIALPHLDDFLLNIKTNNYSQETLYNYERDLEVFQRFLSEISTPFEQVDKKTLLNYKAYLLSRDRKTPKSNPGKKTLVSFSVNRMLSALRSYLKFLIAIDFPTPVAPNSVELVKTEKKHPRVGEFEQILQLLGAPVKFEKNKFVAVRNRALFETLFSTGMRISELVNLRKEQIDNTGRIFIRGKGKKERFVYLTGRATAHLQEYLKVRPNDQSPFLFLPTRGKNAQSNEKRISTNYLEAKVKQYRELLGLNIPITVHGFRHAFATYLAENGANPAAIQILLGHESLDTTTRYVNASDKYAERIHKQFHPLKE